MQLPKLLSRMVAWMIKDETMHNKRRQLYIFQSNSLQMFCCEITCEGLSTSRPIWQQGKWKIYLNIISSIWSKWSKMYYSKLKKSQRGFWYISLFSLVKIHRKQVQWIIFEFFSGIIQKVITNCTPRICGACRISNESAGFIFWSTVDSTNVLD